MFCLLFSDSLLVGELCGDYDVDFDDGWRYSRRGLLNL